jgi:hypothetical protein
MSLELFKNPIVLAIIATILAYLYLYWTNKDKEENKDKTWYQKVSPTIPIVVGLATLFVAYNIFGFSKDTSKCEVPQIEPVIESVNQNGGSIKLPETDVFIDIAKF